MNVEMPAILRYSPFPSGGFCSRRCLCGGSTMVHPVDKAEFNSITRSNTHG